ncbi:MAG TPA: gamma-glutamyl-gamma-aminobutyrate hydrolase family protein, partial [Cyclobacteriaceae bacterium]|nr:gamma-glutamyl-gamma-aminobutyrate hydrolase family protein [Cyclobacteriaceae bacterium]
FYNHPEFLPLCTGGVDERRDEFELRLIDHALSNRLPLLGICRGLQIVNVYSGGTLVPDIPSKGLPNHSRFSEGHDRQHGVSVRSDSRLGAVAGQDIGGVNSAHHQAADLIGAGLIANAFSEDGVIEGLERTGKDERSFLLLVQWHPERMADQRSPLSGGVKQRFLTEIRSV